MKKEETATPVHKGAKLTATKDYSLFHNSLDNRPVNLKKRKKLVRSMLNHGFIPAYPIHCVRREGVLYVRDGQHRLAVAEQLGLPVWYVTTDYDEVDIAEINSTQEIWKLPAYAGSFAARGKHDYQVAINFAAEHKLPLGVTAGLLSSGHRGGSDNLCKFKAGAFKVMNLDAAQRVANLYARIRESNPKVNGTCILGALSSVCAVPEFEDSRLMHAVAAYPERVKQAGTLDGYLEMLEDVYNYHRQASRLALRFNANNLARKRMIRGQPEID
ncbi:MAG: ParB N-terminal domain-containing protein [Candidatus Atribacteria bacterium]|nr:ParB N-terminal domain-containing protein [Candidatus Atribacteria bacterium]